MKKIFMFLCLTVSLLTTAGCGEKEVLRYEECYFQNAEDYLEWIPENYQGVFAEVIEATPEDLVVELQNDLEHYTKFDGWSRACVKQENVWYTVLPAKDIATPSIGIEETAEEIAARIILPEESKEFTNNFSDVYQEAVLPFGEYRIRLVFSFPSDRDPTRTEHEGVWVDFTIEE